MGLIDRLRNLATPQPMRDYWPFANIGGVNYPIPWLNQTLQGTKEEITGDFSGFATGGYLGNPIVQACMSARSDLFCQATFMWQKVRSGTPGELWSSPALDILRTPWTNGTTGDLLARMIQDADLSGNAFILRRPGRLVRLRPDWVTIVHGGRSLDMWDPDAELIGYWYQPGGPAGGKEPIPYVAAEIAHFAPKPDPLAPARGVSWLTALIREVEADSAMTSHRLAFMRQGATPNLVVTGVPGATPEAYQAWVDKFSKGHDGVRNAYKTMYLSSALDAKVVGSDMVSFKEVQGAGETRIAAAAGVPAIVAGISEGLAGSSLNSGNYAASMRRFADLTGRSLWQKASGALSSILTVPGGSTGENRLWVDDRSVMALKDDVRDAAEVQAKQAQAIRQYVDAGFEPDSVVDAINAGDLKRLKHTGLFSVQLQPPQPDGPPEPVVPPDLNPDTGGAA